MFRPLRRRLPRLPPVLLYVLRGSPSRGARERDFEIPAASPARSSVPAYLGGAAGCGCGVRCECACLSSCFRDAVGRSEAQLGVWIAHPGLSPGPINRRLRRRGHELLFTPAQPFVQASRRTEGGLCPFAFDAFDHPAALNRGFRGGGVAARAMLPSTRRHLYCLFPGIHSFTLYSARVCALTLKQ